MKCTSSAVSLMNNAIYSSAALLLMNECKFRGRFDFRANHRVRVNFLHLCSKVPQVVYAFDLNIKKNIYIKHLK